MRYWVSAGAKLKQFRAKVEAEAMERQYQCQKKVGEEW
jgi:hypothetical protein